MHTDFNLDCCRTLKSIGENYTSTATQDHSVTKNLEKILKVRSSSEKVTKPPWLTIEKSNQKDVERLDPDRISDRTDNKRSDVG